MEASSVYMCFPCYQEFPTLEEVLAHQLTCTAEAPTPTPAQVDHSSLQEELPEEQHFVSVAPQEHDLLPDPASDLGGHELGDDGTGLKRAADAPRILYQCGDCEVLFDSLGLWQHHRKQGVSAAAAGGEEPQGPEGQHTPPPEEMEAEQAGANADGQIEATNEVSPETENPPETHAPEEQPCVSGALDPPAPAAPAPPPADPPVRRRGAKKAKPPSSLLCVECGAGFSAIAELVSHRRTQHGLQEAPHRCQVCGEGFLNTTLFLYHRKQHPQPRVVHGVPHAPHAQPPTPTTLLSLQQEVVQVEVLEEEESHGQGLLLLAAAGEGQSLGLDLAPLAPPTEADTTPPIPMDTEATPTDLEVMHVEAQATPTDLETIHIEAQATPTDLEATPTDFGAIHVETQGNLVDDQATPNDTTTGQLQEGVESQEEEPEKKMSEEEGGGEEEEGGEEPDAGRTFLCRSCGSSFLSEGALQMHCQTRHGQSGALHSCEVCGQEFMNTTLFLYHRKEHRAAHTLSYTPACLETHTNNTQPVEDSGAASCGDITMELPEGHAAVPLISFALPAASSDAPANEPIPPPPAQLSRDWSRAALPHRCPHCGRSFTRRSLLRAHVSSHTGQKLFRCALCTKAFSSPANLLRHSQTHAPAHAHSRPHRCHVCAKDFSHPATLKRHTLTHTRTGPRRRRGPRLLRTGAQEDGDGPYLHTCPDCPASFKMHSQLQKHRLLHTSHPFPCEVCGEAFKRRRDLNLHSLTHQEPKSCPHCSAQFLNQTVLEVHLQRCPGNQPEAGLEGGEGGVQRGRGRGQGRGKAGGQLECEMCGHLCVTQEGLELHRLSHTGQTPLRCPLVPCRRRFASGAALGEHVLAHCQGLQGKQRAPSRYRCQHCAKEFAYASTFAVHMRIHTDERPFECSHCGKRFRQLPHLQDHERIHSGLRPFACWVCGKSFSVAARLTEHARVHSGEKPYGCPRCPAAFRSRANLDKHMHLHADDPEAPGGEGETAVQTILLVHQAASPPHHTHPGDDQAETHLEVQEGGGGALILPAEQASSAGVLVPGSPSSASSSVVILHPTITVPSGGVPNISVVEGQEVPHTIEFIIEETV
ncbi:LOW QUALITY PROTEIN: zinc finger protein 574 [Clupea harengus]|uniref:LOW QUALITY PROTEIN: zinc finger protein 574 n=1 Tax=Clupea harengus TaxID=7950 RepID=A0A6P8GBB0_CLUHA|nr:LOW QUALITY PROTEIN: zinc finger protein 574 [Clupea harengus]